MLDAASVGLMCVTKAHRQWAQLRRFSVVMMPRFSVFEKASSAQQTGWRVSYGLVIDDRPHQRHRWQPFHGEREGTMNASQAILGCARQLENLTKFRVRTGRHAHTV